MDVLTLDPGSANPLALKLHPDYVWDIEFDGWLIKSVSSFCEAVKDHAEIAQKNIAKKSAVQARHATKIRGRDWSTATLNWQGQKFKRLGGEYAGILTRLYDSLLEQRTEFAAAVMESTDYSLRISGLPLSQAKGTMTVTEALWQIERVKSKYFAETVTIIS